MDPIDYRLWYINCEVQLYGQDVDFYVYSCVFDKMSGMRF